MLHNINKSLKQPAFKGNLKIALDVSEHERYKHPTWYPGYAAELEGYVMDHLPANHSVTVSYQKDTSKRWSTKSKLELKHTFTDSNGKVQENIYTPSAKNRKFASLKEQFIDATKEQPYCIDNKREQQSFDNTWNSLLVNTNITAPQQTALLLSALHPNDSITFKVLDESKLQVDEDIVSGYKHSFTSEVPEGNESFKKSAHTMSNILDNIKTLPPGSSVVLGIGKDESLNLKLTNSQGEASGNFIGICNQPGVSKDEAMSIKLESVCKQLEDYLHSKAKSPALSRAEGEELPPGVVTGTLVPPPDETPKQAEAASGTSTKDAMFDAQPTKPMTKAPAIQRMSAGKSKPHKSQPKPKPESRCGYFDCLIPPGCDVTTLANNTAALVDKGRSSLAGALKGLGEALLTKEKDQ